MHIIEHQYLGLELKHPSRAYIVRDTAVFAANAYLEGLGSYDETTKNYIYDYMFFLLSNPFTDNYLFTETAQEVLNNIKVSELFDLEILRTLPKTQTIFLTFYMEKAE